MVGESNAVELSAETSLSLAARILDRIPHRGLDRMFTDSPARNREAELLIEAICESSQKAREWTALDIGWSAADYFKFEAWEKRGGPNGGGSHGLREGTFSLAEGIYDGLRVRYFEVVIDGGKVYLGPTEQMIQFVAERIERRERHSQQ